VSATPALEARGQADGKMIQTQLKLRLATAHHAWKQCGTLHVRDVNAARNTLLAALGTSVEVAYA
jgi:hypothetical protein